MHCAYKPSLGNNFPNSINENTHRTGFVGQVAACIKPQVKYLLMELRSMYSKILLILR